MLVVLTKKMSCPGKLNHSPHINDPTACKRHLSCKQRLVLSGFALAGAIDKCWGTTIQQNHHANKDTGWWQTWGQAAVQQAGHMHNIALVWQAQGLKRRLALKRWV